MKFEQNLTVRTIQNFVFFDKKCLNTFDSIDAILEDVPETGTIV